jgi:glycosyltransferase involved in cell wall biosynthesis
VATRAKTGDHVKAVFRPPRTDLPDLCRRTWTRFDGLRRERPRGFRGTPLAPINGLETNVPAMRTCTAVLDLEISGPFPELNTIGDYAGALVLFRLHGRPLGWGAASVTDGRLDYGALVRQLLEQHAWSCALPLAERAVHDGIPPRCLDISGLLQSPPQTTPGGPLVTVAVCSRTPATQLQPCLDSLLGLDYAPLDLVVIDASDDRKRVEALIAKRYPTIRYSCAPGAGAGPRRAVSECRGDILALTHGDAVVDPRWVTRLAAVFLADPEVMTVTGLALPRSIERPFRTALPAGAPFCRAWSRVGVDWEQAAGSLQKIIERSGANVAFWRPGTTATGPYTHVFEPAAIVRTASSSLIPNASSGRVGMRTVNRSVDLAGGLPAISDAADADSLRLDVSWSGMHFGTAQIDHRGAVVSPLWIGDAIAQQLTIEVLDARLGVGEHVCRALLTADLARHVVSRVPVCARRVAPARRKRPAAAA